MTIDTDKLRELAQECIQEDGLAVLPPQPILALLDELDRLREGVKVLSADLNEQKRIFREQEEANNRFQQFANATEQQRLNDARRDGFEHAISELRKIPGSIYHSDLRNCLPPAEWSRSEQCGAGPNIADIDVRPQVQAFIEATKDVVVEHSEELAKHTVYAGNRFKQGCGKELADGQWWRFCGETDMGQTLPAICTECGGTYKLAESEWPHADGFGGGLMGGKE